jgi:hypothetical protein
VKEGSSKEPLSKAQGNKALTGSGETVRIIYVSMHIFAYSLKGRHAGLD